MKKFIKLSYMLAVFTVTNTVMTPISFADDVEYINEKIYYENGCEGVVEYLPRNLALLYTSVSNINGESSNRYIKSEGTDSIEALNHTHRVSVDFVDDNKPKRNGYEFVGYRYEKIERPIITIKFLEYNQDDKTKHGRDIYPSIWIEEEGNYVNIGGKVPLVKYIVKNEDSNEDLKFNDKVTINLKNYREYEGLANYGDFFWGEGDEGETFYRLVDKDGKYIDYAEVQNFDEGKKEIVVSENSKDNVTIFYLKKSVMIEN